jgi:hypothetical protein
MKPLKTAALLTFVIISFSSCDYVFGLFYRDSSPEFVTYNLALSFQDASGNDLVKGIGLEEWWAGTSIENAQRGTVNRDLYVLDIIVSIPCENWDNDIYNVPARIGFVPSVNRPALIMARENDGYCYLTNNFHLPVEGCPEEKILTYKLKCPDVFGEEAVYEFVTYWDIPKKEHAYTRDRFAKCYRIEFEGNEIIPQPPADTNKSGDYKAIIKLSNLLQQNV